MSMIHWFADTCKRDEFRCGSCGAGFGTLSEWAYHRRSCGGYVIRLGKMLLAQSVAMLLIAMAILSPPAVAQADPPDCNDPSDSGPLVPGNCGYGQPGEFQGDYSLFLPIVFGPVQTSQISFQMFRDANGDGSFNAGEWPASWTRKRMYITADDGLVLAPALDAQGGTLSSFTYIVGTELSIVAEESESAVACPIWSGRITSVVPAWDSIVLVPMEETEGCR